MEIFKKSHWSLVFSSWFGPAHSVRRRRLVAGLIVLISAGGSSLTYYHYTHRNSNTPLHGPKLSSLSDQINRSVADAGPKNTEPRPPVVQPAVPVTGLNDEPALGIAAGGGLTGMSQTELDTYFLQLKILGAKWVRWDIDWSGVQPDGPTTFEWANTDRVAATAQKYGIKSLGIITYTPAWARQAACKTSVYCAPADPAAFASFASQVVSRYKTSIHHWEIWNEPNYVKFWQPAADAQAYASILRLSYLAIKLIDPVAVVVSGGLAPADDEGGSASPISFMQAMYASGAQHYFDAFGMHPYSYPMLASYQAVWNAWQQMVSIRQIMVNQGDGSKKIWATEFGAPTGGPGRARDANELEFEYPGDFMSEDAQARLAGDVTTLYQLNRDWLGGFFWYSLKDIGTSNDTIENFFGVLRPDGSKKPAYDALQKLYQ